MDTSFSSPHFNLHRLAEGVFAAISTDLGAGYSNTGIIDLGDRTLVFDAFANPLAAHDLLQACQELTGRKPDTVILSHLHPDHWGGMQVFADCAILSTPETRRDLLPFAKFMLKDKADPSRREKELESLESRLAVETNPALRRPLEIYRSRLRYDLQALPTLQPTVPNQVFDRQITFHGSKRTAELVATGKGHTLSDCVLHLPKERIAFIGDIGFFQCQPFMPYGFPREWLKLLQDLAAGKVKTFVPGHGPLGGRDDLLLEIEYIHALQKMVRRVIRRGGMLKDALQETLPPPFDAWMKGSLRFEANVRSEFKRQKKVGKG